MYARATGSYKQVAVSSATPQRVLAEVFARLQRDFSDAREKIVSGDLGGKGMAIGHAIELVSALSGALDHRAAPEICANLAGLYQFMRERLSEVNSRVDVRPLDEAEIILKEIRASFEAAGVSPA